MKDNTHRHTQRREDVIYSGMSRCLDIGSSVERKMSLSLSLAEDRFSDLAPRKSHSELLVYTAINSLTGEKMRENSSLIEQICSRSFKVIMDHLQEASTQLPKWPERNKTYKKDQCNKGSFTL